MNVLQFTASTLGMSIMVSMLTLMGGLFYYIIKACLLALKNIHF